MRNRTSGKLRGGLNKSSASAMQTFTCLHLLTGLDRAMTLFQHRLKKWGAPPREAIHLQAKPEAENQGGARTFAPKSCKMRVTPRRSSLKSEIIYVCALSFRAPTRILKFVEIQRNMKNFVIISCLFSSLELCLLLPIPVGASSKSSRTR